MSKFVLEIGTEELPARFLLNLQQELKERFSVALQEQGLEFGSLEVAGTPRRATVLIAGLSAVAKSFEETVMGPPVRVAFMESGEPSKAGLGFARTQGVEFSEAFTVKTDKGEYLSVKKQMGGGKAVEILPALCQTIIQSLSFPKRMHWGYSEDFTFARPLRWLLALLDSELISFKVGGVESGRQTFGHRVHGPGPFSLDSADAYQKLIAEKCGITLFPEERRKAITEGGDKLAAALGGKILWKQSLLDEVSGLTEHPVPLIGSFDPSFLEVPREVLLTSMESHQKSFGLEDASGKLLPAFLTVLNITPPDEGLVRKGWERVLRARLEDGRFFWKTDLNAKADDWLAKLDNVIFLAPIGSMGDKTRRLEQLCLWLAEKIDSGKSGLSPADAARAGRLSKADLVSEMVKEFDTLQGIMGGIYARKRGESEQVSQALAEQYLPAGPDSPVPSSLGGALLSLADKADTLVGCFGLGMIPTGAADPYALRRAALGIIRIMLEKNLPLDASEVFRKALELYGERKWKLAPAEALGKLDEFFALRLKNYFCGTLSGNLPNETLLVEAALGAGAGQAGSVYSGIASTAARLKALTRFSQSAEFSDSVLTFKRAANIIRKQGQESAAESGQLTGKYRSELLQETAEKELAQTLEAILPRFDKLWAASDFEALFALLGELRPKVGAFFDQVMVMAEDKELRQNRLQLLYALVERLGRLADFNALQI